MAKHDASAPTPTVSDAIVGALRAEGVDTVFGIPGYQSYHLFDAFHRAGNALRVVHSRHEQGAAYMAFGYAKSTGRLGVVSVVPGPGVLNASAALLTAQSTSTPVLCLAGEIPQTAIGLNLNFLHEMRDQTATLRTIVKWAARAESADAAATLMPEALAQATSGRPGVASLDLPMDVQGAPATMAEYRRLPAPAPDIDSDAIKSAAAIIAQARRPMIMVGGGAIGGREQINELARMLGAPVMSFRTGKGIVSDRDPLGYNVVAGYRLWPEVDVVIAIGTRLEIPHLHWSKTADKTIIRIDIDPKEIDRYASPQVAIVGDAKAALDALLPAVAKKIGKPSAAALAHLADIKNGAAKSIQEIQPQVAYLQAIRDALPDDGFFVDEVTQVGYVSWYAFPGYQPRRFITSGFQGNLGHGYGTALGVKVANPKSPVVLISGDGGFMFNVQELATAVRERLNVVAVIFNNNLFGNVARDQNLLFGGRTICTDLKNPDFPTMAESFGAHGWRAQTPDQLRRGLEKAFTLDGPVLIEVPLQECANPWPLLYPNRYAGFLEEAATAVMGRKRTT